VWDPLRAVRRDSMEFRLAYMDFVRRLGWAELRFFIGVVLDSR
jgi:hypothetical protein